jgi:putative toxin-antitoxin system antitoxin component (TIGR02293 family)
VSGADLAQRQAAVYLQGKLLAAERKMSPQSIVESILQKLGGRAVLGRDIASEAELATAILAGIPLAAVAEVRRAGFSEREIEWFVIPSRTRRHRERRHERLTVDESDRLVRVTRLQALAEDVFGDPERANKWLRAPLGILDGRSPLDFARIEAGARIVEQLLGKIAWGAAA